MPEIIWDRRPEEIFVEGYAAYVDLIIASLQAIADSYAPRIEAWMKANAPWQDQTGNARQGLHTEVETLVNGVALHLAHGVDYSHFLEWSHQGRFSILMPALDVFAAQIWTDVQALFR